MPKRFAIARCSLGIYGIITCDDPQPVTYADGNTGVAWTGIVVRDTIVQGIGGHAGKTIKVKEGNKWCSKRPVVISYLYLADHLTEEELITFSRRKLSCMNY